jgi:phosphohistidine phosphatase
LCPDISDIFIVPPGQQKPIETKNTNTMTKPDANVGTPSSGNDQAASPTQHTTNAHDLAEAAKLQARLSAQKSFSSPSQAVQDGAEDNIPSVSIDEGAHKYVLITASTPASANSSSHVRTFVYSKLGAHYHRNVAEYLVPILQRAGYYDIRITGGGRIFRDSNNKQINIFGYSYGFGKADHELALEIVDKSGLFDGYTLNFSNDGY